MRADSATSVKCRIRCGKGTQTFPAETPFRTRNSHCDSSAHRLPRHQDRPGKVSFGTTVTAETADGKTTDYHIVGAWDGDPDKNLVSYKTKFGEALLGAKVGDTVQLPHGDSIRIKKISALPEALAKELSPED